MCAIDPYPWNMNGFDKTVLDLRPQRSYQQLPSVAHARCLKAASTASIGCLKDASIGSSRSSAVIAMTATVFSTLRRRAKAEGATSVSRMPAGKRVAARGRLEQQKPGGPPFSSRPPRRRRSQPCCGNLWDFNGAQLLEEDDISVKNTIMRVVLPSVLSFVLGTLLYTPVALTFVTIFDAGDTGQGPILNVLGMDQSQFMQNFLTVNGLLFTILCGNTYTSLYNQQETLFTCLFVEVSEAKSLLEQACLVCQNRPFFPKVLECIGDYVENDLRRLDVEPAELLAKRPMYDPLENILYVTSVGVPSIIYETIRDLRVARGNRLGAMQRKLPAVHFVLLYALGALELLAFPLLGAGTVSMFRERAVLNVQAVLFGSMCGAIVMTLQVVYELWKPCDGAYTVERVLQTMVSGLEEELEARLAASTVASSAMPLGDGRNDPMVQQFPGDNDRWYQDQQYYADQQY